MIVRLATEGAVVEDADNCSDLHVQTDLAPEGVATALAMTGVGEPIDADNAWLDLAVLRTHAKLVATAPDWPQRWAAMAAYAETKGWLSDDGRFVRAHIEH